MEQLGKPSGLVRRKSRWYYRVRVPSDLCGEFSFGEKWVSLRTGDYAEALKRLTIVAAQWQTTFAEKRSGGAPINAAASSCISEITDGEALRTATKFLQSGLREVELISENIHSVGRYRSIDILAELDTEIVELSNPLHSETERRIYACLMELGFSSNQHSPALFEYVRRAKLQLAIIERARFMGDYSVALNDTLFSQSSAGLQDTRPALQGDTSETALGALAELFWEKSVQVDAPSGKTLAKYKAALDLIVRYFGERRSPASISSDDCEQFRDYLVRLPSNLTKRFGSLSFEEAVAQTEQLNLPTMEYHTQLTYLQVLGRFFRWSTKAGHISRNVADGLRPRGKKPHRSELRDPFSLDELRTIFNAPLYTGSLDDERRFDKPGPTVHRRSRFWVPLVALFSGMRLGEILQLDVHDVVCSPGGVNYFRLYRNKAQKNEKSRREIPIHPELVSIGFLDFVDSVRSAGGVSLFPEVVAGSDNYLSSSFGKKFATFAKSLNLDKDSLTCFHSFRHNFADALRHCGAPQEEREMLGGWTRDRKSSRSYGFGFDAELLDPWMRKLRYKGLDLTHLHTAKRGNGAEVHRQLPTDDNLDA